MDPFPGFPSTSRHTPVPDALLGSLMAEMDSLEEVKTVLRALHLLHRKKGFPQAVSQGELEGDPVLRRSFVHQPSAGQGIRQGLERAVRRGVLLRAAAQQDGAAEPLYLLNTEANRRALEHLEGVDLTPPTPGMEEEPAPPTGSDIFTLYEEHIGVLTPLIVEDLKEVEAAYPPDWVRDAFREAARYNKRSWRYVVTILERWGQEGRGHGEPGRYPAKSDPKAYLRGWRRLSGS